MIPTVGCDPLFCSNALSLDEMPLVIYGYVLDLADCSTHGEAVHLLEGLTHEEKSLIFRACPPELQRRLWAMKQEAQAA